MKFILDEELNDIDDKYSSNDLISNENENSDMIDHSWNTESILNLPSFF